MPFRPHTRSTTARGYGRTHQQARAAALAQLGRDGIGRCSIGGEPIYPGQPLHLDHDPADPSRSTYRGLACARHNSSDGARRGRARQVLTQQVRQRRSW